MSRVTVNRIVERAHSDVDFRVWGSAVCARWQKAEKREPQTTDYQDQNGDENSQYEVAHSRPRSNKKLLTFPVHSTFNGAATDQSVC